MWGYLGVMPISAGISRSLVDLSTEWVSAYVYLVSDFFQKKEGTSGVRTAFSVDNCIFCK